VQLLQVGLGYSPLASGLRMQVFTMMPMVFAPLAGIGADRIGNRPFMAGASRPAFLHGLTFALAAAAVAALVAALPPLLGPSRAQALASVTRPASEAVRSVPSR
jgi:ABC-type molybdate transport system permease subunit